MYIQSSPRVSRILRRRVVQYLRSHALLQHHRPGRCGGSLLHPAAGARESARAAAPGSGGTVLRSPCARQTGKTSALLALRDLLNSGVEGAYRCVYVHVEVGRVGREDLGRAMRAVSGQSLEVDSGAPGRSLVLHFEPGNERVGLQNGLDFEDLEVALLPASQRGGREHIVVGDSRSFARSRRNANTISSTEVFPAPLGPSSRDSS